MLMICSQKTTPIGTQKIRSTTGPTNTTTSTKITKSFVHLQSPGHPPGFFILGHHDTLLIEELIETCFDLSGGIGRFCDILDPEIDAEFFGLRTYRIDRDLRLTLLQHVGMFTNDLLDVFHFDRLGIGGLLNSKSQGDPDMVIAERPVDNVIAKHVSIGDDDFGALLGKQGAAADTDLLYPAPFVANLHRITDTDGTVEDQDDARYKIIDDILQAQADADTQGAEDNRDTNDRKTGSRHRQQKAPDQEHQAGHQQPGTLAPVVHGRVVARIAKEIGDETLQKLRQPNDPQEQEQSAQREHEAADLPWTREEVGKQVIERIEQVQVGAEDDQPEHACQEEGEPADRLGHGPQIEGLRIALADPAGFYLKQKGLDDQFYEDGKAHGLD